MSEGIITRIAVLGAGTMGNGIAQVCAMAGYTVALHDPQPGAVDRALGTIRGNLDRGVERGKVSPEAREPKDYATADSPGTLPYDYVWFTPAAAREDPCAAIQKPKGHGPIRNCRSHAKKHAPKLTSTHTASRPALSASTRGSCFSTASGSPMRGSSHRRGGAR